MVCRNNFLIEFSIWLWYNINNTSGERKGLRYIYLLREWYQSRHSPFYVLNFLPHLKQLKLLKLPGWYLKFMYYNQRKSKLPFFKGWLFFNIKKGVMDFSPPLPTKRKGVFYITLTQEISRLSHRGNSTIFSRNLHDNQLS